MIKEQTFIKKDTSINWDKAKNFIPKENEVIIYTDLNKKKIGNGINKLHDLPFIDLYEYSIKNSILIISKNKEREKPSYD